MARWLYQTGRSGRPDGSGIGGAPYLHVWARCDASYAELGSVRFDSASNPVTLAQSGDILYLCLPGHAELKDLLLTKKVANALPAAGVVINHATGDPGAATQIGIGYLDAPVCVGRSAAV